MTNSSSGIAIRQRRVPRSRDAHAGDILSSGKLLYGLATDDAHHFARPWDPTASRPGRGWVMVRAARLESSAIISALERGDFYATTGVVFAEYEVSPREIRIVVKADGTTRVRVRFTGRNGRLLQEFTTYTAVYAIRGDEGYVRAKVIDSNGLVAWTQPVMLGPTRK